MTMTACMRTATTSERSCAQAAFACNQTGAASAVSVFAVLCGIFVGSGILVLSVMVRIALLSLLLAGL